MSFVKIWVHIVFGTKNRAPFLTNEILAKVINHIKENSRIKNIFIDSINGYHDHLHCLVSLGTDQNLSKVVNLIKGEASHWINQNHITTTKFEWANEYYAASVSDAHVEKVRRYIDNQAEHHRIKGFSEEFEVFIHDTGSKLG